MKDHAGDKFIPLMKGLEFGEDFMCLPQEAWNLIVEWYGVAESSHVIIRYLRNTAPGGAKKSFSYENYPPIVVVQKLRDDTQSFDGIRERSAPAPCVVASRQEKYQNFLRRAKDAANINIATKVQVWKLLEVQEADLSTNGMPTPAASRENSPVAPSELARTSAKLVIDLNAFTKFLDGTHREVVDLKDETANEKYNGSSTVEMAGFLDEQTIILEEQIRNSDDFVSDKARKAAVANGVDLDSSQELKRPTAMAKNGANPTRTSAESTALTRSKNKKGRTRGCTGLTNLGNTCYMNSALQCIRSVEELAIFFLEEKHKSEINTDNPLGHHGVIAKAYEGFLHGVYQIDSTGSFAPRVFKNALGRCAPLFSGYGQQDSQEFLSFLVDGLHEDLNRVRKKPYRENPDSDDNKVHDPDYIKELGQVYRDNHYARNDSVAMDLFSGFYKNTMVCPSCDKVSVTFDPYSLVTLQLPIESTFQHVFTFAPLIGHPINVNIDIDKNSNMRMVKEYVAKRFPGTKAEHLIIAELYTNKVYKVFEDFEVIGEANVQSNDRIWLFELDGVPTNLDIGKKKKKAGRTLGSKVSFDDLNDPESPLTQLMAIPVLHRCQDVNDRDFLLRPWIVTITREEARDLERLKRKILRMVQATTTADLFSENGKTKAETDDALLISQDDKDDDGVQARSVESEDSLVDITMSGQGVSSTSVPRKTSPAMDSNFFIEPGLMNCFALSAYGSNNEAIPSGWTGLTPHSLLTNIETRMQRGGSRRESRQSNGSFNSRNGRDTLAVDSEDDMKGSPSLDPSDTEDVSRSPRRRMRFKEKFGEAKRSISKAFKKNGDRRSSSSAPKPDLLIRPGEGLVIDWHPGAYHDLFGGESKEDLQGQPTVNEKDLPVYEDKELEARKARRNARRKNGVTLSECFEETSKSEVLSEENAWYCGRCKELRRATKTLEIWTAPDILVVHLKRFSSTSRLRDKIDVLVDAPVEGLDLSKKVGLPEGKSLIYDLFAVDNHYGGLGGGHYTAYAQNFFDKQWYEYNDSSVSSANPAHVVTKAAYLLFYRRRSDKPLGPQYLQDIVHNAYNTTDGSSPSSFLSGEDQRPDDPSSPTTSHRGSSTSSLEAAAGQRVPNAATRHSPKRNSNAVRRGFGSGRSLNQRGALMDEENDSPPSYNAANGPYIDEGIGMEDDVLGVNPDSPLRGFEDMQRGGATLQEYRQDVGWGFDGIGQTGGGRSDDEEMKDADGSGSDATDRNLNDFVDDDGHEANSPIGIDQNDHYDGSAAYYEEHVGLKGGHQEDGDQEEPVVDIVLDQNTDMRL